MRFSVILPTYNRAILVKEALASVGAQTRAADEVIVVADGCTDGSVELIRDQFPSVIVLDQANTGLAGARNAAVARATGDWLCFLDDDDVWDPRKLGELEQLLSARPEVRAVYHPVWTMREGERGGPVHAEDFAGQGLERLLLGVPSVPSALAVERLTAIQAGLFPPHVAYGEDWIFDVNVGRLTDWTFLSIPLATVSWDGERMSASSQYRPQTHFIAAPMSLWTGRPDEAIQLHLAVQFRAMFRPGMQATLRARQWKDARRLLRWMQILLPRRRDRLFLLIPDWTLQLARNVQTARRTGDS